MDHNEVRAGIQQAKVGENGKKVFAAQAIFIAAVVGVRTQSAAGAVAAFIAVAIVAFFVSQNEKLRIFASIALGIGWAVIAHILMKDSSSEARVAVVMLAFLFGIGGNIAAFQSFADITRK